MLFIKLSHLEWLLALPAQLPTSLRDRVVEVLKFNVTEVGVVGDDLDDEVGLLRRSDSREYEEITSLGRVATCSRRGSVPGGAIASFFLDGASSDNWASYASRVR